MPKAPHETTRAEAPEGSATIVLYGIYGSHAPEVCPIYDPDNNTVKIVPLHTFAETVQRLKETHEL